jgi:cellulose synthase/poly-beta-1,6-N-acetylglucosamine synthase-like glycosyltransferase
VIEWAPWASAAASVLAAIIVGVGLSQVMFSMILLAFATVGLARRAPPSKTSLLWDRYADRAPGIAIVAPAYNEASVIVESVNALLSLQYPDFEVIVVNDGSSDDTLQILIDTFGVKPVHRYYDLAVEHAPIKALYANPEIPSLLVVDKVNGGGKSDAMNAAINVSRCPLFVTIDVDSILEPDALLKVVKPFIDEPEKMVAVGGTIRVVNGCEVAHGQILKVGLPRNFLALVQTVEYLRAFLMARVALSQLQIMTVVSGAFGLFRRDLTIEVGGFSHNTVGEDMELVIKLHRHMRDRKLPYRIDFVEEPVCWTEAPSTLKVLKLQRARWQRGSLETFFKHKDMLFNPRYGRVGFVSFLQILLVDVLGPIAEVAGYALIPLLYALGMISIEYVLAFVAVVFTFGVFVSVVTLILEEVELRRFPKARDLAILTAVSVVENFGYRQINNVWRVQGYWQFLRKKGGWGQMTRTGFRNSSSDGKISELS